MQFSLFVYIHFEYVWFYNFRLNEIPKSTPPHLLKTSLQSQKLNKKQMNDIEFVVAHQLCHVPELHRNYVTISGWTNYLLSAVYSAEFFRRILLFPYWSCFSKQAWSMMRAYYCENTKNAYAAQNLRRAFNIIYTDYQPSNQYIMDRLFFIWICQQASEGTKTRSLGWNEYRMVSKAHTPAIAVQ